MPKLLSSIENSATIQELQSVVDVLAKRGSRGESLVQEVALPVREARAEFSRLLNNVASNGEIAFIESGDGPAVLVIAASRLAEAVLVLKDKKKVTVADAVAKLPYKKDQLTTFTLKGHRGRRRSLFDRLRPEQSATSTNSI